MNAANYGPSARADVGQKPGSQGVHTCVQAPASQIRKVLRKKVAL